MSKITRKKQMKKIPQLRVGGYLRSKKYSKSNGYSMKKGKFNA